MNFLTVTILGVVEGLTEFLPVSSTGHMILTARLLNIRSSSFLSSFEIAIQLGAVAAVVFLYGRSRLLDPATLKQVAAAFIPTAVAGLLFYKPLKSLLLHAEAVVLWSMLLGGVGLIVFEKLYARRQALPGPVTVSKAFWIGVCQSVALIPGVSRSAATIVGGLLLGVERKQIVEFSFLLAVPTMLAATGLDLAKSAWAFSLIEFAYLAVGFIVSFAVALGAIKLFLGFVQKHTFLPFGVYRIAAALGFWYFV